MMLLQAGQLGLYRKDSFWTDEIPPDMVAGATMWLDFTDTETLFSGADLGGGTPSDGQPILSVADKVGVVAGAKYIAGGALTASIPGSGVVSATKHATGGTLQMEVVSAFPDTNASWASIVSSTTKLIVVGVKVRAANPFATNPWVADAILFDGSGYCGLHVMQSDVGDGSLIATAYNYSSGTERADRPIATNQWQVITLSQQAGSLRCRVNGGTWASVSSAATAVLTGNVRLPDGVTLDADIAHIATFNTAQTDAAISAVEHWIANDLGITRWW